MSYKRMPNTSQDPDLSISKSQPGQSRFDGLRPIHFWSYGVGHFMNDLGGAIYFNYLFYFLKRIVQTSSAPMAFLAGQITDGLATPLVGYLSDKTETKYGQRTPWYVGGFVIFLIGYFPIYQNFKKIFPGSSLAAEAFYYVFFLCVVNIGWAAVQISHMSMVPLLTCSVKRRDQLNNRRNSFTFLSNLIILISGTILFATLDNPTLQINILSYIGAFLGISASIFFIWGIKQVELAQICTNKLAQIQEQIRSKLDSERRMINAESEAPLQKNETPKEQQEHSWVDWFKLPSFYIYGFCYMSVRLYCNLFGILLPFYLVDVIHMGTAQEIKSGQIPFQVALVTLVIYLFQYLTSTFIMRLYDRIGRKATLSMGTILCVVTSLTMIFLTPDVIWAVYIVAAFIGVAQASVLSTGINLISDVVGRKGKKGAFVFGAYSFLDKVVSGLAIFFITNSQYFEDSVVFKKWMTIIMPSISCILSCTVVLFTPIKQYSKEKKTYDLNNSNLQSDNQEPEANLLQELAD